MKSKEAIWRAALSALRELENAPENEHPVWWTHYRSRLQALCDVLDDDIPEKYWERLGRFVCLW